MKAKKILSAFIAATMVLSTMCFPAFAETAEPWDGSTIDTSWYNTEDITFTILDGADLAGLAAIVNGTATDSNGTPIEADTFALSGNSGKTIILGNDIDLDNKEWTPIGTTTNWFQGNLDGNEKTIRNLKITGSEENVVEYAGLFGYIKSGPANYKPGIADLTIENVEISGVTNGGAFCGGGNTTTKNAGNGGAHQYNNVKLTGLVKIEGKNVGGLVGGNWADYQIHADGINVDVDTESLVKGEFSAGGVFASSPHSTIYNITSNIDVEVDPTDSSYISDIDNEMPHVGGIAGDAGWTLENIICTGDVKLTVAEADGEQKYPIATIIGVIDNNAYWSKKGYVVVKMFEFDDTDSTMSIMCEGTEIATGNGHLSTKVGGNDARFPKEPYKYTDGAVYTDDVAIEETKYYSIGEAVRNSNSGDTIKLLAVRKEKDVKIPADKNVTIDFADLRLTGNIINNGTLTIKNGKDDRTYLGNGSVQPWDNETPVVVSDGSVTFEDLYLHTSPYYDVTGLINITGGNATFKSGVYTDLNVSNDAQVTIEGADFVARNKDWTSTDKDAMLTSDITVEDTAVVKITSGDFDGKLTGGKANFAISGGTYVQDPSSVLADEYMAVYNENISRYEIKETVAMVGEAKYLTFAEAVEAAEENDEITLIKTNNESGIAIDKSMTINVGENAYMGNLNVSETAEVTIKGTSTNNSITLKNSDAVTGYNFGGWFTDSTYTTAVEMPITTTVAEGTTYYQKWAYEIAFNANGADGEMAAQAVDLNDETTAISTNAYTMTGYNFTGWNTAADGTGTAYAADVAASTVPAGTTLYAQWSINQYTLTFKETGDNKIDAITANYNSVINTIAEPTRVGYIFDGWKVGETKIEHENLPTTMPAENITYVGQWKFDKDNQGITVNGGQQYKTIGEAITALEETGTVGTISFKTDEATEILVKVAPTKTVVTENENMGANADNVKVVDNNDVYAGKVMELAKAGANDISRVDTVVYEKIKNVNGELLLDVNITPVVNYTLNGEAKTENLTFSGTSVTVTLKVDAALNGGTVKVTKGDVEVKTVNVESGIVEFDTNLGFSTYTLDVSALNNISNDNITDKINVVLKKTADTDNKYELWLESADSKRIFNFTAADFKFEYENENDKAGTNWEMKAVDGIELSKTANGVYHFNVVEGVKDYATAKTSVKLADITFNRYGTITFTVLNDEAEVRTTYLDINVPKAYNEATNTLVIDNDKTGTDTEGDAIIDGIVYDEKKVDVKINFEGLFPVRNDKNVDYQDMTITITRVGAAADETKIVKLGAGMYAVDNDNATTVDYTEGVNKTLATGTDKMISKYVIDTELAVNSDYIITIEGAGYRTYTYKIEKLKSDAILTFWNDAKLDNTMEKVMETDANAIKVTFLAGDIVSDGIIDVYDLNAVVSYWDSADGTTTDLSLRQYDLDRDGDIDIDDVSMVIAGWNN